MGLLYPILLLTFKWERREFPYLLVYAFLKVVLLKPEEYGLFNIQGSKLQYGGNTGCPHIIRCHVPMECPYDGKGERKQLSQTS